MLCCNLSSTLSCNFDAFVPVLWQTTNKYINQSKTETGATNQERNPCSVTNSPKADMTLNVGTSTGLGIFSLGWL